jgi:sugar-specific transcriptional regulator TrmB
MIKALGNGVAPVRSLRRALKSLVDNNTPADPKRYCANPMLAALAGTKEEFERLSAIVEADQRQA